MTFAAFLTAVSTVGFPIAAAVALGFIAWKMYMIQRADKDKYSEQLTKSQETTASAIETIKSYSNQLICINDSVKRIETKIDELFE